MKTKFQKHIWTWHAKGKIFFVLFLLLLLVLAFLPTTKGDEKSAAEQKQADLERIQEEYEKYKQEAEKEFSNSDMTQKNRLANIRVQMEKELQDFDISKKASEEATKKLKSIQRQITTLSGQVKALEIAMEATRDEIKVIKMNILKRTAELQFLAEEADKLAANIESQKKAVMEFLVLLQTESPSFGVNNDIKMIARTLLSGKSFSHDFWQEQQIMALENVGQNMIIELEEAQNELDTVTKTISQETVRLQKLKDSRRKDEERLERQVASKDLLKNAAETREGKFQQLLEQTRQQMEASTRIIADLEGNKSLLEEKMGLLDKEHRNEQIRIAKARKQQLEAEEKGYDLGDDFLAEDASKTPLLWPVQPKKGLSAVFHDPTYKSIFGMEHNAIDIPTPQGTEIQAPALGYVYKVSDNGMGYSSLIIAHRNNIMTVYGHVSKFLVKEGDLVHPRDIIALSGGMPGTRGAGVMTTGPHLHFEVFDNGVHVDPLQYLPKMK